MVELVRLYSKQVAEAARLRSLTSKASASRQAAVRKQQPRQRQRRLSMTDVAELIKEYEQQVPVKDLAQRFASIVRPSLPCSNGTVLNCASWDWHQPKFTTAADLCRQGWSLVQLGARFGVDSSTVWRALRDTGVTMRPS
jgi:hypothetical protein